MTAFQRLLLIPCLSPVVLAFSSERTFALESFLGAPALRFSNPGNPDLKSEIVQTTEFGLELGFLNNRINLSGTYYKGITKDALFTPTQPPSSGLLNQIQNIGEIENMVMNWLSMLISYKKTVII